MEHWHSGYCGALLRRSAGPGVEGSSPSCSALDGDPNLGEAIRLATELVSKTSEASPPLRVRSSPSPLLEGAPPARQLALNTSGGPRGPRGSAPPPSAGDDSAGEEAVLIKR
jgi:hypothetical protein